MAKSPDNDATSVPAAAALASCAVTLPVALAKSVPVNARLAVPVALLLIGIARPARIAIKPPTSKLLKSALTTEAPFFFKEIVALPLARPSRASATKLLT